MQFYDFKEIEERVILIGVQTEQDEDVASIAGRTGRTWRPLQAL